MRVRSWRPLAALLMVLGMSLGLAACGDTWQGMKEDTSDNTAAVGRGMEKAGEKVQDTAQ
jgi:predicted small secreted protein